jgi:hypothetical protein
LLCRTCSNTGQPFSVQGCELVTVILSGVRRLMSRPVGLTLVGEIRGIESLSQLPRQAGNVSVASSRALARAMGS